MVRRVRRSEAFWQGVMDSGVTGAVLMTTALEERDDLAVEEGRFEMRTSAPTWWTTARTSWSTGGMADGGVAARRSTSGTPIRRSLAAG